MPTQDNDIRSTVLDAYTRLDHHQLQLFLRLRSLSTTGSYSDLVVRLTEHDLQAYQVPKRINLSLHSPRLKHPNPSHGSSVVPSAPRIPHSQILSNLPIDLISEILDHIGCWELSRAVGVPTSLPQPSEWDSIATPLDRAIISASLPRVRATAISPPFTRLGATYLIRFDLLDILEYLWSMSELMEAFRAYYGPGFSMVPTLASLHDRPRILNWWLGQDDIRPKEYRSDAVDGAARNAALSALAWWAINSRVLSDQYVIPVTRVYSALPHVEPATPTTLHPPLNFPPLYTSQALEAASHKAHINVLTFFTAHGWPLRAGRSLDIASTAGHVQVLDWWAYESGLEIGKEIMYDKNAVYHASCTGKVGVLEWWKEQSERGKAKGGKGIQMIYDSDALVGATKHNKPEVLEWWDKSGLPISYRMCDIEEALEDAIGGGAAARAWWARKGVNFRAGDSEWMKLQSLN